jgi:hemolysin D
LQYRANLSALDSELAQQKQALEISREEENKLSAILPLVRERAATLKELTEKRFYDRHTWLKIEQERIMLQSEAAVERHRVAEIEAELRRVAHRRIALKGEFQTGLLEQLAESEKQIQRLTQELLKARQRGIWQQLKAPVTGIIQELQVHTVGGVVTPAQNLMVVVPKDHPLEIEAWILNKDIGFVESKQVAEIKLDTFPFARYGTLAGTVSHISRDVVEHESLGFGYPARISMTAKEMRIDGKLVNLTPGMDVTVEIKTGKRRLIEYVLSPLLRYQTESMRER